jgi:hypothetical protein
MRERILRYAHEDIDEVKIRVDWDVPHIIKSCSDHRLSNANEEVWSPATHVVILQDSADNDLMATTCKDYLTKNWDDNWSQTLLRLLDRFTKEALAEPTRASRARASRRFMFRALQAFHLAVSLGMAGAFLLPASGLLVEAANLSVGAAILAVGAAFFSVSAVILFTETEKRAVGESMVSLPTTCID